MTSPNWKVVDTYTTEFPADSIEWCPIDPYLNYFVCGTYQLLEQEDQSATQERIGAIFLMKFEENKIQLVQKVDSFGILDLKWCVKSENDVFLGAVTAKGDVNIFRLQESKLEFICGLNLKTDEEGDYMTLALNWGLTGEELCVTDNKGNTAVLVLDGQELKLVVKWKSHDLETWTVAFDVENSNLIYSGGDDAKLKLWDQRDHSSKGVSSFHDSGVTIIQPDSGKENLILVGSFDENLNFFDPRRLKTPVYQIKCSGGLWRAKRNGIYVLTANIYGGFQIIDLDKCEIVGNYKEHASLAYGADWSFCEMFKETPGKFHIGACSFYDKKLTVSVWDED